MALETHSSDDGHVLTLNMPEKFAFDMHAELRGVYVDKTTINQFIVDLSRTDYLDSSALGMLLQLREHAGDRLDSVRVVNAKGNVREILKVANFEQMVTID